jgi:cytochrome P450
MALGEDVRLDELDLGSLEFWDQPAEVRDHAFALLRRDAPVSQHQPLEDILGVTERDERGYWAIVRYEDIRTVSRDPATFCSGQGTQFGDAPQELLEATQSFLAMDAPRHTKLRGLVSSAFTPRQVKRIEDGIHANARLVVEEAAPTGGGDFVELIAKRLPLITISDMIGVPESDREEVVRNADTLVTVSDRRSRRSARRCGR